MSKSKKAEADQRTLVTFLLDETGSMESIKDDTIGGFNSYLFSLKAESTHLSMSARAASGDEHYKRVFGSKAASQAASAVAATANTQSG